MILNLELQDLSTLLSTKRDECPSFLCHKSIVEDTLLQVDSELTTDSEFVIQLDKHWIIHI